MTDEEGAKAVIAEVKADAELTAKFQKLAQAGIFGSQAPRPRQPPPQTLIECVPSEHRSSLKELTPDGGAYCAHSRSQRAGERARPRAKCNFEFRAEYFSARSDTLSIMKKMDGRNARAGASGLARTQNRDGTCCRQYAGRRNKVKALTCLCAAVDTKTKSLSCACSCAH